jgi:imidazolonepropionase-like amidohydrolase
MTQNSVTYLRVVAAAILATTCGCGAPMSPPREADLLIVDARVVTATGDVLDRASVVVSDGRIQDIVVGGTERTAATVITGTSYTVVPGLIDIHAHLLAKSPRVDSDAAMAAYLNETLPALLDEYLAAGFTSVLSNGDFWPAVADAKARVNAGAVRGPRIFILGPLLIAPGAQPTITVCADSPWCWEHVAVEVDDEQQAREAVDRIAEAGADGIEMVYGSAGNNPGLGPGVIRAIVERANAHGLPVMIDTHRPDDVSDALGAGVSRFVHTPQVRMSDELVDRVAAAGVAVATTVSGSGPFWGRPESPTFEPRKVNVAALAGSGALVAFGTDNVGDWPVKVALAAEIDSLLQAPLTPGQVLAALTVNAAAYLGRFEELGTIEIGKRADLLIVDGDPLADLEALKNVVAVVKDGALIVDYR